MGSLMSMLGLKARRIATADLKALQEERLRKSEPKGPAGAAGAAATTGGGPDGTGGGGAELTPFEVEADGIIGEIV